MAVSNLVTACSSGGKWVGEKGLLLSLVISLVQQDSVRPHLHNWLHAVARKVAALVEGVQETEAFKRGRAAAQAEIEAAAAP